LPGFVDLLAGQADIGGGWSNVLLGNFACMIATLPLYLTPLLRRRR
jgi:hypothetical protein